MCSYVCMYVEHVHTANPWQEERKQYVRRKRKKKKKKRGAIFFLSFLLQTVGGLDPDRVLHSDSTQPAVIGGNRYIGK